MLRASQDLDLANFDEWYHEHEMPVQRKDIVERLTGDARTVSAADCREAAAEIVRLRSMLTDPTV